MVDRSIKLLSGRWPLSALAVALSLFPAAGAVAGEKSNEKCDFLAEVAEKLMTLRQTDADLTFAMEAAAKAAFDDAHRKLFVDMVLLAYDEPLMKRVQEKKRAAKKFSRMVASVCVRG